VDFGCVGVAGLCRELGVQGECKGRESGGSGASGSGGGAGSGLALAGKVQVDSLKVGMALALAWRGRVVSTLRWGLVC